MKGGCSRNSCRGGSLCVCDVAWFCCVWRVVVFVLVACFCFFGGGCVRLLCICCCLCFLFECVASLLRCDLFFIFCLCDCVKLSLC